MKILLLDYEKIYFQILKMKFKSHEVQYESNPVTWFEKIHIEKTNLNEYDFIFCDYFFDNLSMNAFQLNISKYIRDHGFKNNLILFSSLTSFREEDINLEYFNLVLDKNASEMNENGNELVNILEEKCKNSILTKRMLCSL